MTMVVTLKFLLVVNPQGAGQLHRRVNGPFSSQLVSDTACTYVKSLAFSSLNNSLINPNCSLLGSDTNLIFDPECSLLGSDTSTVLFLDYENDSYDFSMASTFKCNHLVIVGDFNFPEINWDTWIVQKLQGSYRCLKVLEFDFFLEKSFKSIFSGNTPKQALEFGIVSWNFKNLSLEIKKRSDFFFANI